MKVSNVSRRSSCNSRQPTITDTVVLHAEAIANLYSAAVLSRFEALIDNPLHSLRTGLYPVENSFASRAGH